MKGYIYFDMDGVLAGLYDVPNWLSYLLDNDPYPYLAAAPLINLSRLARILNRLQREGYYIGIVSWLSNNGTAEYNKEVTLAKKEWLRRHLPSVLWDEIKIVPYGIPKQEVVNFSEGILFDDEANNRNTWRGQAYDETQIFEILKIF